MDNDTQNPFRPGWGERPPHRAGHEDAAFVLAERLGRIGNGEPGGAVVMCGPRGNGKTALLGELARAADAGKVRHEPLTAEMMAGDQVALASRFAPRKRISLAGAIAGWARRLVAGGHGLPADEMFRRPARTSAWDALHASLREGPVLLTVDDADGMPVDFGQDFLQAAQDFVAAGLPLFVVLAGTPGLPAHLGKMRAGFWGRSKMLRIGRLETAGAVRDALAIPARDSGMPIDGDALALLVEESQGCPFVVQTLGHGSWEAAHKRGGTRRITAEDARNGIATAKEGLRGFCGECRSEMRKQGVLGEAEAVSRVVVDQDDRDARLTGEELMAAVESVAIPNGRDPDEALERLMRAGLVWKTPDMDWVPGIPSLCASLVEWEGAPAK